MDAAGATLRDKNDDSSPTLTRGAEHHTLSAIQSLEERKELPYPDIREIVARLLGLDSNEEERKYLRDGWDT